MRDAARKAIDFSKGMGRESLDSDEKLALSLVRLIEIVGEAAKSIQDSLKMKYPHIPWKLIARTRDRLIHGYFDVDLDVVWKIVTQDLPPLVEDLEELLLVEKDLS
jgi:uncharacterized protein with HEPN domain